MLPKKFTPGIDCMFVCQKISLKWWPNYGKFDEDPVFWEVDFVFFTLLFRAVNTPGKFSNFEKLTLSITAKPNMERIWYRRFKIHFKAKRHFILHSFRCAFNLCCGRDSLHISKYPYTYSSKYVSIPLSIYIYIYIAYIYISIYTYICS